MSRTITLKLTQTEADALCHAAGNSLNSDQDDLIGLFNEDRTAMLAAVRALKKLRTAINAGDAR